jgi:hypothetical protein
MMITIHLQHIGLGEYSRGHEHNVQPAYTD